MRGSETREMSIRPDQSPTENDDTRALPVSTDEDVNLKVQHVIYQDEGATSIFPSSFISVSIPY